MKLAKNEIFEEMKKLTFGVEIEMFNLSRDKILNVIANFYGSGCPCDDEAYDDKDRTWKVCYDGSIHGYEGWELVTPILTYDDMEDLQEIVRELRRAGAKSNPSHGCGVHIHVGAKDHTGASLRHLVNIMASHETLLSQGLKLDEYRTSSYARPVDPRFVDAINKQKPVSQTGALKCWYESQGYSLSTRSVPYNNTRYHMLNLHSMFGHGTVEFRLFQFRDPGIKNGRPSYGGLHAGELKAYIQLCLALTVASQNAKSSSPKEPQMENPKFSMRTWLCRLGFIGEEFATARKVLTENLEGNAAFRFNNRPGK